MANYTIDSNIRQQMGREVFHKGDIKTLSIDYNPWADDNAAVSGVTWTIESGQATVVSNSLTANVASAVISTAESGNTMLKAVATDGTNSKAFYIRILAKDPTYAYGFNDYGLYT